MRSSKETYQKVALECSEYEKNNSYPINYYNLPSSNDCKKPTCVTCKHFKDEHCVLDLYDKIEDRIGTR